MRQDADEMRRPRPVAAAALVVLLAVVMAGRVWSVLRSSPGRPTSVVTVEDPRQREARRRYFDERIRDRGVPLHPAEFWRAVPLPGEEGNP